MKKFMTQTAISLLLNGVVLSAFAGGTERLTNGVYAGVGGSWNTIDETFDSALFTSTGKSGNDDYDASRSRLSPMVQLGYWAPLCNGWLWGASAQWKYLGYNTDNVGSSHGQGLPNATFSSINFFGPMVVRDFASQTWVNHEVMLLFYIGKQLNQGYAYLGVGPALLTASNTISVSSIHKPFGVGDNLISTSVSSNKTVWGGAIQIGYNYYLDPTFFLNLSYTYLQTGKTYFNNSVNAGVLNGFGASGTTLNLHRRLSFRVQEVMFSVNKAFEI